MFYGNGALLGQLLHICLGDWNTLILRSIEGYTGKFMLKASISGLLRGVASFLIYLLHYCNNRFVTVRGIGVQVTSERQR